MELFHFNEMETLTSEFFATPDERLKKAVKDPELATFGLTRGEGAITFRGERSLGLRTPDIKDQFVVFQLSNEATGQAVLESSQVEPALNGGNDEPDVMMKLEMQAFNIGANEDIDPKTRATMRITIGKDENSRDGYFETAFWSIAVGLNLYNKIKKKPADGKDLNADFNKAFSNRPIEIPGGLSKMSFEVVKHEDAKWWQQIFSFLKSGTGQALTSVLGFPAVTLPAINAIDALLNKLDKSNPKTLFKSRPLRLALSKQAKDDYTGGSARIKLGCLNRGFCILARGRDLDKFIQSDSIFYPSYGKLVPGNVSPQDLMSGNYDDPLRDVTYAVFKLDMKETKLDPTFSYNR